MICIVREATTFENNAAYRRDSPEDSDKPDTKQGVDYPGECFQILNAVLVPLLQGFIFIKLLQRLFLLLFIHIDQLVPSKKTRCD